MKLVLVLVVMCLVGAALSKSTRNKRSLDQTRKRDLEKLLKLLLESNDKKDTAAKRWNKSKKRGQAKSTKRGSGGNGPPCKGPSIPPPLATLAKAFKDGTDFDLAGLVAALTPPPPPEKKRMLHQKRGGGGAGKAVIKCVEELLEDKVEQDLGDDPETVCTTLPENWPDVPEFNALFTGDRPSPLAVAQAFELYVPALVAANTGLQMGCAIYWAVEDFEYPCGGPLFVLEEAVGSLDISNPNFQDLIDIIDALAPVKRRRGLFHWTRSKRSTNKRGDDDGPGNRIGKCLEEAFEYLDYESTTGTCDIEDYWPTSTADLEALDALDVITLEDYLLAMQAWFDNVNDDLACMWEWMLEEEEVLDDRKK